jgi:hypothetical protein
MPFCSNCGQQLSTGTEKFCPNCGKDLREGSLNNIRGSINIQGTGGNVFSGPRISNGIIDTNGEIFGLDVSGSGIIIGKNITTGSININSLNKEFEKVPDKYAESLRAFSENLNREFEEYKVPEEKANEIQKSIVELAKQVEGVVPEKEREINYIKQTKIEAQTFDVIDKVLDAIPPSAETVALFTPLSPFNKLIRGGVQKIVDDAVKESKNSKY